VILDKKRLFVFKYIMILANFLSNWLGLLLIAGLAFGYRPPLVDELVASMGFLHFLFTPLCFLVIIGVTLHYERDFRRYLNARFFRERLDRDFVSQTRKKLLNYPYLVMALDMAMWCLAGLLYAMFFMIKGAPPSIWLRALIVNVSTGLITVTTVFFVLEGILQKRLIPLFFPKGGLSSVPGTWRIRISHRLTALLLAANIIPGLMIWQLLIAKPGRDDTMAYWEELHSVLTGHVILFMVVGILLTWLVARNMTRPFDGIIRVLNDVRHGQFDRRIPVTSNDEIGYTADVINEMSAGLRERDRVRHALALAMEVQQSLIPNEDPVIHGLDIAGRVIYCDETGGDYYDYLFASGLKREFGVIVGDVADHGIQSALLMATARAFFKQRWSMPGSLSDVMGDVNRQFCRDVRESGQFMTAFCAEIHPRHMKVRWVNAGHEPAMLYDPDSGLFRELGGRGLAIGLNENYGFKQLEHDLRRQEVLVIATDGVWETHDSTGKMFGRQALQEVIRLHAHESAREILDAVIGSLDHYRKGQDQEDDVTMVIVKITGR
jgi:phosphoserine phosphatase RsbU/P